MRAVPRAALRWAAELGTSEPAQLQRGALARRRGLKRRCGAPGHANAAVGGWRGRGRGRPLRRQPRAERP
eukprot:5199845-Prymnesium_polylepis.1